MTFATEEVSVTPSPIELYKFVGTDQTFYMTSHNKDVVSGGNTYVSTTIKRDQVQVGTQENDDIKLSITIPVNNTLILNYAFDVGPPNLELFLYKCHASDYNDTVTLWQGKVISFSISGREASLLVPSLFSYFLNGTVPAPRYQNPCNHILYDDYCRVNSAANSHTTTISAVNGVLVTLASDGGLTGFEAGEMLLNGRSQRRMIISKSGLVFQVTFPFMTPGIGNSVTIRRGCDHSFDTCRSKFSNGANYGGFPYVPNRNPFGGRI